MRGVRSALQIAPAPRPPPGSPPPAPASPRVPSPGLGARWLGMAPMGAARPPAPCRSPCARGEQLLPPPPALASCTAPVICTCSCTHVRGSPRASPACHHVHPHVHNGHLHARAHPAGCTPVHAAHELRALHAHTAAGACPSWQQRARAGVVHVQQHPHKTRCQPVPPVHTHVPAPTPAHACAPVVSGTHAGTGAHTAGTRCPRTPVPPSRLHPLPPQPFEILLKGSLCL